MNAASLPVLWANCVDRLKDRVNNRSFWEAVEATRAVTIENDTLIIGMGAENFNRATHLQQASLQNTVNTTVEEVFNKPLRLRIIEGTTLADWENAKTFDSRVKEMKLAVDDPKEAPAEATPSNWDGVYEQISRLFTQAQHRATPQGKARYANEALYLLVEAMDALYQDNSGEASERSLARALERIANNSEIPAAVLAFEMERLRAWRRSAAEE